MTRYAPLPPLLMMGLASRSMNLAEPEGGDTANPPDIVCDNGGGQAFTLVAEKDAAPLSRIQLVKGSIVDGKPVEQLISVRQERNGFGDACIIWTDPIFDPKSPAYWYMRVDEVPTPRWSKYVCEAEVNCADRPGADMMVSERAWNSPIWYLP